MNHLVKIKNLEIEYQAGKGWRSPRCSLPCRKGDSNEQLTAFLPILETPYEEFMGILMKKVSLLDAEAFQYELLLVFALTSTSEYWQGLALKRVSEFGLSQKIDQALVLVQVAGYSQKNRHQAKRLAR